MMQKSQIMMIPIKLMIPPPVSGSVERKQNISQLKIFKNPEFS
jgi:hypothetical protein